MATRRLSIPLSEEDVRGLNIWDVVYLDGPIFTCRFQFHVRAIEQNILPPVDFEKANVMFHMGGIMRKIDQEWNPISLLCTSSIRFEKMGAPIIEKTGVRAIIGKSTMGPDTMRAMKKFGCVHLSWGALIGNILAKKVKRVVAVHDLDELGPLEATWVFEVEEFGPFVVDMDTKGNNLFTDVNEQVKKNIRDVCEKYQITDFGYTA